MWAIFWVFAVNLYASEHAVNSDMFGDDILSRGMVFLQTWA